MIALESWMHSPGARALGWTLFHFLWEGALIAGLLAVALSVLKPSAARLRYATACGALAAMVVAFGVTLAVEWPSHAAQPAFNVGASAIDVTGAVFDSAAHRPGIRWSQWLEWAPVFWMAGVLGLYLYRLGSWVAVERLRRMGSWRAPEEWQARLLPLAQRAGVTNAVALLESCLTEVPILIGYLKPAIVLPAGLLTGLPAEQVEAILLHELAHIRRADYLVNLVQAAVEGLLFYHPAVWWVSNVVRAERENCCDDAVVHVYGNARTYAEALYAVEQKRAPAARTVLAATGGSLAKRIRRMLGKPEARDLSLPVAPSAVLLVLMAVALVAWTPARSAAAPKPAAAATAQAAPTPAVSAAAAAPKASAGLAAGETESTAGETKPAAEQAAAEAAVPATAAAVQQVPTPPAPPAPPLPGGTGRGSSYQVVQAPASRQDPFVRDAAYIISDEERAAFLRLQTPEEQAKFVEQFWSRRDAPGAPAGSSREEYNHRVSYALANYSNNGNGVNALGRTYIKYGPPDSIDDQGALVKWHYNHIALFHSPVEFDFARRGNGSNYVASIASPAPLATFTGQASDAPVLAEALNRELSQRGPVTSTQIAGLPEHASFQIQPDGDFNTLVVPLAGLSGRVDILAQVQSVVKGAAADSNDTLMMTANLRDSIDGSAGTYQTGFHLLRGTYACQVLVRESSSGRMYTEVIHLQVN